EARVLLEADGVVHRAVLDALEPRRAELARLPPPARLLEGLRAQETPHDVAPDHGHLPLALTRPSARPEARDFSIGRARSAGFAGSCTARPRTGDDRMTAVVG